MIQEAFGDRYGMLVAGAVSTVGGVILLATHFSYKLCCGTSTNSGINDVTNTEPEHPDTRKAEGTSNELDTKC